MNIIIFLIAISALAQDPIVDIQNIARLTVDSIDHAIKEHPYIIVDFYAPWCAPCRQFEPEYSALNEKVQKEGLSIRVASYDATKDVERIALEKFKITSFPSFLFFMEGRYFVFDGQRSSDSLLSWMKQLINAPQPKEVASADQLDAIIKENEVVIFYQGAENAVNDVNFWTFFEISKTYADAVFTYAYITKIGKPGALYIHTRNEKKQFNQAFTKQNIQRFILKSLLPDVPRLSDEANKLVFSGATPAFILFSGHSDNSDKTDKAFMEVANLFKSTYQFAFSKVSDESFFTELDKLGADDGVFPKIIAIDQQKRYKYNGPDFTVKGIKNFIFEYRQGKLEKFIKSEPIPTNNNGYVKQIVSLNYEEEIINSKKDVLLEFYADWCGACKQFKPTYDLIGYELRNNPNLVVAQINMAQNEINEQYQPHSYPDIVFFKASDKPRKAIPFTHNDRDLNTIVEFVRNYTSHEQKQ